VIEKQQRTLRILGTGYRISDTRYRIPEKEKDTRFRKRAHMVLHRSASTQRGVGDNFKNSLQWSNPSVLSERGGSAPGWALEMPQRTIRIPGTRYRIPDTGYRIPDAGYRIPETGYRAPETGYRMPEKNTGVKSAQG
jgi:hypothetical protein